MADSLGFFVVIGAAWLAIGLVLSIVMGRRGHDSFSWLVLGTVLGPLAVVLAVEAGRHNERLQPAPVGAGTPVAAGTGPVDVLVGYDGSPQSTAAIDAVSGLLGDRLGRADGDDRHSLRSCREPERLATEALRRLIGRVPGASPQFEVLHGHPSTALSQYASERGYELIAGRFAGRRPHPRRDGQRSQRAGPRQQGARPAGRRLSDAVNRALRASRRSSTRHPPFDDGARRRSRADLHRSSQPRRSGLHVG